MIIPNNTNSLQQINFLLDRNALNGKSSVLIDVNSDVVFLFKLNHSLFIYKELSKNWNVFALALFKMNLCTILYIFQMAFILALVQRTKEVKFNDI